MIEYDYDDGDVGWCMIMVIVDALLGYMMIFCSFQHLRVIRRNASSLNLGGE